MDLMKMEREESERAATEARRLLWRFMSLLQAARRSGASLTLRDTYAFANTLNGIIDLHRHRGLFPRPGADGFLWTTPCGSAGDPARDQDLSGAEPLQLLWDAASTHLEFLGGKIRALQDTGNQTFSVGG